jgi:hypothetical protein
LIGKRKEKESAGKDANINQTRMQGKMAFSEKNVMNLHSLLKEY